MKTETAELSRAYQIWQIIEKHPGIQSAGIARKMQPAGCGISDAVTKLHRHGHITYTGKKGLRAYTAVKTNPPPQFGRGSYDSDKEPETYFLKPTPGNPVFSECRKNWQGYELNRLLSGVRA